MEDVVAEAFFNPLDPVGGELVDGLEELAELFDGVAVLSFEGLCDLGSAADGFVFRRRRRSASLLVIFGFFDGEIDVVFIVIVGVVVDEEGLAGRWLVLAIAVASAAGENFGLCRKIDR